MKNFLHIGVWRGGKLVDDRYVPEKGQVTVGSSGKNTIALIGSNLPREHVLIGFKQKHPTLHVTDGMNGEVALDGKKRESLGHLAAKGHRTTYGFALDLPDTTRGWVALGDATFFFHVTYKPPPPPKRTLPASAKTGLFSGLDFIFTFALVAVVVLEAGGIAAVQRRPDPGVDRPTQADLDRFAEIIMPQKPKKQDDAAAKKAAEEAKKKAEEEAKKRAEDRKKQAEAKAAETPEQKAAEEAARKAKLAAEVQKKGLLNVLGSNGGSGALQNLFQQSNGFSNDIGQALAGAGGVKIATGADLGERKGLAGGSGPVGIGDLGSAAGGGHHASLAERRRMVVPNISIDSGGIDVESTSVDKESLARYIQYRKKALEGCYDQQLKLDPTLKGKIVVSFTITTQGRVTGVSIDENTMGNDDVAACIKNLVRTWFFPVHPDQDAPVSFPFLFAPG